MIGVLQYLAVVVIMLWMFWRIFSKAGHSPWWSHLMTDSLHRPLHTAGSTSALGLLIGVPVIMIWVFAFVRWPAIDTPHEHADGPGYDPPTPEKFRGRFRRSHAAERAAGPQGPRHHPQAEEETTTMHEPPKKVVLAYSGGLDTSVILRWLQETYGCEVVTFTADIGQGEELEPARAKAEALGVRDIRIENLRETFVRDYVFPMFRANAIYEGVYLLGTSIARPLIARRQIEIARETGADAVAHGATGKGNDQVRFELGYYAHDPDIRVIAPWREWDIDSSARPWSSTQRSTRSRSRGTSAASRPTRPTPTSCTSPTRARRWRTRGWGRTRACSPARSHPRPRRTGRPPSRSSSKLAMR